MFIPYFFLSYDALGLLQYTSSGNTSRSLFYVLVPLAILIIVLALQIRYFTPSPSCTTMAQEGPDGTSINFGQMTNLVSTDNKRGEEKEEREEVEEVEEVEEEGEGRDESDISTPSALTIYRIAHYVLFQLRRGIVAIWYLSWRLLELHLHKAIVLSLFGLCLYEVSASYLILVALVLLIAALPIVNGLAYPAATLYLALLSLGKFLFQISLIESFNIDVDEDCVVRYHHTCSMICHVMSHIPLYRIQVYLVGHSFSITLTVQPVMTAVGLGSTKLHQILIILL